MKDAKFTEFTERCLALGREGGWGKEIKAKENLAWEIYEAFPPTGGLLLGQLLFAQFNSYIKPEINSKEFAKEIATKAFEETLALPEKDAWDHYYLGVSYQYGRCTKQDLALAAEAYDQATLQQNPYSAFEAIWACHLAGGSRLDAIFEFNGLRGALADFAAYSSRALTLLELGPPKELASREHFTRLRLMRSALHTFINHDHGQRQINIAIEKELREGIDALIALDNKRCKFALALTEEASRKNRSGKDALEWFREAVDPDFPELVELCRSKRFSLDQLIIIVEQAKAEGWEDAELATLAVIELRLWEDEYD